MGASVAAWERGSVDTRRRGREARLVFTLSRSHTLTLSLSFALTLFAAGCRQDMHDQPKYKEYRGSAFFSDGRSVRPLVADTVARGHLDDDALFYTGKSGAAFANVFPFPVTPDVLRHGQERYNIYCSPCHDRVGNGNGMIVRRGYRRPPSYHIDRLRAAPPGYFFDVITHGFGVMPDYATQVPVNDRWAIVAYIRALQLSQHAGLMDVPAAEQPKLARVETESLPLAEDEGEGKR